MWRGLTWSRTASSCTAQSRGGWLVMMAVISCRRVGGYGLWRSGRPHQAADHLDLSRVRAFFRGYASTALSPNRRHR